MVKIRTSKSDGHKYPIEESGSRHGKGSPFSNESKNHDEPEAMDFVNDNSNEKEQRKLHTVKKIWSWDEADDDLQEKILEKLRTMKYENQDDYFAEDEGILYDNESHFAGHEVFKDVIPKYYDVGGSRGGDYIQFDLDFENNGEKKLADYLGIHENLRNKIDFNFKNDREVNTKIEFHQDYYGHIDLSNDTAGYDDYIESASTDDGVPSDDMLTFEEYKTLLYAHDKWENLMDTSLINLRNNYEYQFSDEALIEDAKSNEWDFDEDGNIV